MHWKLSFFTSTLCSLFALVGTSSMAQEELPSAQELLAQSVRHHDPQGRWRTLKTEFLFAWRDTSVVQIDLPRQYFSLQGKLETHEVTSTQCEFAYERNGKPQTSNEFIAVDDERCERSTFMRNYVTYLTGLPMKLQDPGTQLRDEVILVDLLQPINTRAVGALSRKQSQLLQEQGHTSLLKITVDYAKGENTETWDFFLKPETKQLVHYQFYRSDDPAGGEYLILSGLLNLDGVNVIQKRDWYYRKDDKYLGTEQNLLQLN